LHDWANYLIDRELKDKPQVAKDLGKTKLGDMKSKLQEILNAYPDLAADRIGSEVFWPHRIESHDEIFSKGSGPV
jgi:hypothetical protein